MLQSAGSWNVHLYLCIAVCVAGWQWSSSFEACSVSAASAMYLQTLRLSFQHGLLMYACSMCARLCVICVPKTLNSALDSSQSKPVVVAQHAPQLVL